MNRAIPYICAALIAAAGLVGFASADDETAAPIFAPTRAAYPEGPTVVGGTVYWAEMNTNRVRRWRGGEVDTAWSYTGCGPTAVEITPDGGFWVICHLSDRLVRLDADFQILFEVDRDVDEVGIPAPNDASPDGEGGVYVSSAGLFSLRAEATGRVLHVNAEGEARVVLSGLRYANGVAFNQETRELFVSEHLNRRVWRADLSDPDAPATSEIYFDLNGAGLDHEYELAGPDGLLIGPEGELLVAEYGERRLLLVDGDGVLAYTLPAPAPFVTNLAFAPWDSDILVVTASYTNTSPMNEGVVATVRWR